MFCYIQSTITPAALPLLERNLVPDALIRLGIQRELEMELAKINKLTVEEKAEKKPAAGSSETHDFLIDAPASPNELKNSRKEFCGTR